MMKMAFRSHMLLAAVVLCGLALTLALPGDIPRWCRCRRTTRAFISPNRWRGVEIISPGAYCPQKEIIVTLKNKRRVCVASDAKWLNKVIEKFLESKKEVNSSQISPTGSTAQKDGANIVTRA